MPNALRAEKPNTPRGVVLLALVSSLGGALSIVAGLFFFFLKEVGPNPSNAVLFSVIGSATIAYGAALLIVSYKLVHMSRSAFYALLVLYAIFILVGLIWIILDPSQKPISFIGAATMLLLALRQAHHFSS
ncbi:hypothetical protein HY546_03620 [archaeon]|nr:hypothetical protein [archaeon]